MRRPIDCGGGCFDPTPQIEVYKGAGRPLSLPGKRGALFKRGRMEPPI